MASQTSNLNLTLPTGPENVSRQVINTNMSIIDSAVGAVPSGQNLQSQVTNLANESSSLKSAFVNAVNGTFDLNKITNWVNGEIIRTNGDIGTTVPASIALSGWRYANVEVSEGNVILLNAKGGDSPRAWCFADSSNKIISHSEAGFDADGYVLIAPTGTAKIIINDMNTGKDSYIGKSIPEIIGKSDALPRGTDLNNFTEKGFYQTLYQTEEGQYPNAPSTFGTADYGFLIVNYVDVNTVLQVFIIRNKQAWYRVFMSNAWTSWIELMTESDVNSSITNSFSTVITEQYSSSKTYEVGDYALRNQSIYRCNTNITTGESWNPAKWDAVYLADDLNKRTLLQRGLARGTDFNNVKKKGFYQTLYQTAEGQYPNAPSTFGTADYGFLIVNYVDVNTVLQVFIIRNKQAWYRVFMSNAWTAWNELMTESDVVSKINEYIATKANKEELNTEIANRTNADASLQASINTKASIASLEQEETARQNGYNILNSGKVNVPETSPFGTLGQVLMTLGNGQTVWGNQGLPTDQQTAQALSDWLENHPEAVATVLDHSLTINKLVNGTLGFVIPEMYGAVGDGVTDDTLAFESCINAGLPIILIEGKTYNLDSLGNITNLQLYGFGGKILFSHAGYLISSYEKISIDEVVFDFGGVGYGLVANEEGAEIVVKNCVFENTDVYAENSEIAKSAVLYANAKNAIIEGNRFADIRGHGVYYSSPVINTNTRISRNTILQTSNIKGITSCFGIGSYQDVANTSNFDSLFIADNMIDGFLGSGIACHCADNVVIKGNICKNSGEHGIVYMTGKNAIISENLCDTQVGCGVRIQSSDNTEDTETIIVSGNNIVGNGVLIGGASVKNLKIFNNIITAGIQSYYGIRLTGVYNGNTKGSYNVDISENRISGHSYPIYTEAGANYNYNIFDNIINNKKKYGLSYGGFEWIYTNGMDNEIFGIGNIVESTVNGTHTGDEYTFVGNRLVTVSLSNYNVQKNRYIGVAFDYDGDVPVSVGAVFYRAGGNQIGEIIKVPDTDAANQSVAGYFEYMIDSVEAFAALKESTGTPYNFSDVTGIVLSIKKNANGSATEAVIQNVKAFVGNTGVVATV